MRAPGSGVGAGDRCHAVVRPEKLQIAKVEEPAAAGHPSVEGVVEAAVYLGTATQMVVKLAADVPLTVLVPNADEAERQQRLRGGRARAPVVGARAHARRVGNGAQRRTVVTREGGRRSVAAESRGKHREGETVSNVIRLGHRARARCDAGGRA